MLRTRKFCRDCSTSSVDSCCFVAKGWFCGRSISSRDSLWFALQGAGFREMPRV